VRVQREGRKGKWKIGGYHMLAFGYDAMPCECIKGRVLFHSPNSNCLIPAL
jgi:hypothetical protein